MPGYGVPLYTARNNTTHAFGGTYYNPMGMTCHVADTTEAENNVPFRTAGTVAKLFIRVAGAATGACSVTVRKNGADTAMTVAIGSGATGEFQDIANTVTVAAGDLLCYKVIVGGASGTLGISCHRVVFTSNEDNLAVIRYAARQSFALNVASTTRLMTLAGLFNTSITTDAGTQTEMPVGGTFKNLCVYVSANARVNATAVSMRINGSGTNPLINVSAGATGLFEDTTNTAAFAAGDTVNYRITTSTGTESITFEFVGVEGHYSTNAVVLASGATAGSSLTSGLTRFWQVAGYCQMATTESATSTESGVNYTMSNAWLQVSTNTLDGATQVTLRKGGADTTITFSVGAGATGQFSDTTHTEVILNNDEVCWQGVAAGTTGTLSIRTFSSQALLTGTAAFNPKVVMM